MTKDELSRYWRYFESLDEELNETCKYVEHCSDNLNVYSNAFARIILAANSEIDVICRVFSEEIDSGLNYADHNIRSGNIREYAKVILRKYPKFVDTTIESATLREVIQPWKNWSITEGYQSPIWWENYQKLKHYRNSNFKLASLENSIYSLGGLFILLLYLTKHIFGFTKPTDCGDSSCFFSNAEFDFDKEPLENKYKEGQLPDFQ